MSRPSLRLLILGDDESCAFLGPDPNARFGLEVQHRRLPPLALIDDVRLDTLWALAPDYVLLDLVHEHGDLICGELPTSGACLRLPAGLHANRLLRARAARRLATRLGRRLPPARVLIHRLLLVEEDGAAGAVARRANSELRQLYDVLAGALALARQLQPADCLRRSTGEVMDSRYRFALRERLGRILRADLAGQPVDTRRRPAYRRKCEPLAFAGQIGRATVPWLADTLESPAPGLYRMPAADPLADARAALAAAAVDGNLDAVRALASSSLDGRLGIVDRACARDWQAFGAALGDLDLACSLAKALIAGDGLPRRREDGLNWLRHAASSGSAAAKAELARHYQTGELLPLRLDAARALLRHAAETGEREAVKAYASFLDDAGEGDAADCWRSRAAS